MFGKFFGKKSSSKKSTQSPQEESLLNAIKERKKNDPLVGMKIGSKEVVDRLLAALKNEKGVHVESLLGIIGSLAGYSCHAAIRDELINSGKHKEKEVFTILGGADEKNYYFGNLPNKFLVEDRTSVWSLVAGVTNHLSDKELPDIKSIFTHVSGTVGGDQFGIPQIPEKHELGDLPINYVKSFWEPLLPLIDKFCDRPFERPVLFGLAAQQAIEMGKDVIPPHIAAKLVMECAIPMSKIGPEWLGKKT